jgi:PAS domain S-box-containing protein
MFHSILRFRALVGLTVLATLPLLVVGVLLLWQVNVLQYDQTLQLQNEIALRAAQSIQSSFERIETELSLTARGQNLLAAVPEEQVITLERLLSYDHNFEELFLTDELGRETAHVYRTQAATTGSPQQDDSGEALLSETLGANSVSYTYSPVWFDKATGEPLIMVNIPLINLRSGAVEGSLGAVVRMNAVETLIQTLRVGQSGAAYVMDGGGRIIVHPNPQYVQSDKPWVLPADDGFYNSLDGKPVLLSRAFVYLGEQTLQVVTELPRREAQTFGSRSHAIILAALLFSLAASGVASYVFVRAIITPIESLAETAAVLAAGDLEERSPIKRNDEIGMLALSFNEMAGRISLQIDNLEEQVTERTRELQKATENLQAIFENSPQSFLLINRNLEIQAFNRVEAEWAQAVFGRQMQVGDNALDYVPESLTERFLKTLENTFNGVSARVEYRALHGDPIGWKELHYTPVYNQAGEVSGAFYTTIDISDRKNAEIELARQAEKLLESNRELEQFAYVASHDLQEPLRMVTSYLQLLQRRYAGQLDEKADRFIEYAVDGSARMKRLINDLLAYSRVGTRTTPFEAVNLGAALKMALRNLEFAIEDAGAVITRPDNLPVVQGDAGQLEQLFQNLLSNALKFSSDAAPQVNIALDRQDDHWVISISDNGIGIAPEHTERIFAIFQRLHSIDEYEGTGIGLAVCKKIVERHHGSIWVESTPGEGTTFFFSLPVSTQPSTENEATP